MKDPLKVVDREKHPVECLENLLAGRSAFLVCGGPSAKDKLHKLNRRGIFSLAVNNAAGNIIRPQAFVCSDPPLKFSHSIWQDPAIMKFVPEPKFNGYRANTREKKNGVFKLSDLKITECPNVWGFKRESFLRPDDDSFFESEGACWGNLDAGVKQTGEPKTVCTMLIGLRLLAYLGAGRVYLLGVDFRMAPDYGYAFNQARDEGASDSNNSQFQIVNTWLCKMQETGVFERRGIQIFNCYDRSGLRAFPYVDVDVAVKDVVGEVEEVPDLSYWYEKSRCKCGSWHIRCQKEKAECLDCGKVW